MARNYRQAVHNFFRRTAAFFVVTLAALLSLSMVVHIPAVQQFGIDHMAALLGRATGTQVAVGKFGFNVFNHLSLHEIYIEEPGLPGDTLIYAHKVDLRFASLLSLTRREFIMRRIYLDGVLIDFERQPEDRASSLSTFFDNFARKDSTNASVQPAADSTATDGPAGFSFDIRRVVLRNVLINYQDFKMGRTSKFDLERADFVFDAIDHINKEAILERAAVDGITVDLFTGQVDPAPGKRSLTENSNDISALVDQNQWKFLLSEFSMINGEVKRTKPSASSNSIGFDVNDLDLTGIEMVFCDLQVEGLDFYGALEMFRFQDKSGLALQEMSVPRFTVNEGGVLLQDLTLRTEQSSLENTVHFQYDGYEAFRDFLNEVDFDINFQQTNLAINDLLTAAPSLNESTFFTQNGNKSINLTGQVSGPINRLRGDNLNGRIGDMRFQGEFRSRDLTIAEEQRLTAKLNSLSFNAEDLRNWLPNMQITEQFDLLGQVNFNGTFDGYLYNFVAYGNLQTDLGQTELDMMLDLSNGTENSTYSGGMTLMDFDLGTWSGDPNLGVVSLTMQVDEGNGLTSQTAKAILSGNVDKLVVRNYVYRDVQINGQLVDNYFNGDLIVSNEDIDLMFSGIVDLREEDPEFDFRAEIEHMNLKALNLSNDSLIVSGTYEIAGLVYDNEEIDGVATASKVAVRRGDDVYTLDTIDLRSTPGADGSSHYSLNSDYINGILDGNLRLMKLIPAVQQYLYDKYPRLFKGYIPSADSTLHEAQFTFDVTLNQPEEWVGLVGLKQMNFVNLNLQGSLDVPGDLMQVKAYAPTFSNGVLGASELTTIFKQEEDFGEIDLLTDSLNVGTYRVEAISGGISGDEDLMYWYLETTDLYDSLRFDLRGSFTWDSTGHAVVRLLEDSSMVFGEDWKLSVGNRVAWGKDFIDISNFKLERAGQSVNIADIDEKGIQLEIDNFDIHYIDAIWDYDKLDFYGNYTVSATIDDLFNPSRIASTMTMPNLIINSDSYGEFQLEVNMDNAESPIEVALEINRPGSHLRGKGSYYTNGEQVAAHLRNTFQFDIELDTFPATFLEYFLGDNIDQTTGYAVGTVRIEGDTVSADMDGTLRTNGFETTVVYLGEHYEIVDHDVRITKDYIDFTGATLIDSEGNSGTITGGMTHTMFGDMGLDITLSSPGMIALNTAKEENEVYYGRAFGAIDVRFEGPVKYPDITVNGTTREGTHIFIPLDQGASAAEDGFLRFVTKDSLGNVTDIKDNRELSGVDFEMNLRVTPAAIVEIIFDEQTQDILRGRTSGDLQIEITRTGDISMYGGVEVESGDYVFTNLAVVTKPFVIRPGGTVRWSGDPYDAQLSIIADYNRISTSLSTFLEEYLINASASAQEEARIKTNVQLELLLNGSLEQPTINFNIEFPDVTGELSGYVDSKMKTLEADQNAMNEQVFGLLWAGTFLPSNLIQSSSSNLATVGITNTLSEFISSQLSLFLSGFLEGAVEGVDFISGIDFTVGYNQSYDYYQNSYSYTQWEVSVQNRLFNDRFIVDLGGNYVTDSPVSGTYFAGDYALEYILTSDRRLKVRFYHRNEETIEGRKNKTGIGLSYRREFDTFAEWLRGLDREAQKLKELPKEATTEGPN